jgi:hypothetical protein
MTRQLTITAAERASVQPDGTLWLVREGVTWGTYHLEANAPPAVFVQACAPCNLCGGGRHFGVCHDCGAMTTGPWCPNCGGDCGDEPCPACRIELVGPCGVCDGDGYFDGWDYSTPDDQRTPENIETVDCADCDGTGTVTLGHACAIGQPLPIIAYQLGEYWLGIDGAVKVPAVALGGASRTADDDDKLDKWALQLRVVGS